MSQTSKPQTSKTRWHWTKAKKWEGDDQASWAVFRTYQPDVPAVSGLTRKEVDYHRKQIEDSCVVLEQRACRALNQTWQAIGYDILQAYADEKGHGNAERVSIPKAEVIDAVTSCGFVGGYPMTYGNDKDAVTWLDKLPRKEQDRICKLAFPFTTYGA